MTSNKRRAHQVIWIECLGFIVVIGLSWLDEFVELPRWMFGGSGVSNWRESALESIVALLVWLAVLIGTKRVLNRFYYLEDQLKMCAWCRRFERSGEWLSLEDYLKQELGIETSHGICANCGRKLLPSDPETQSPSASESTIPPAAP